jgi:hypothetical protein
METIFINFILAVLYDFVFDATMLSLDELVK